MSDLIDRQAAIDIIDYLLRHNDDAKRKGHSQVFINGMEDGYFRVRSDILSLPSVQPDIIHCKDCKHWMPYDWMFSEVWQSKNMDDYPEDEIGCAYCDMNMGANDFCSRPERRTDD